MGGKLAVDELIVTIKVHQAMAAEVKNDHPLPAFLFRLFCFAYGRRNSVACLGSNDDPFRFGEQHCRFIAFKLR